MEHEDIVHAVKEVAVAGMAAAVLERERIVDGDVAAEGPARVCVDVAGTEWGKRGEEEAEREGN